MNRIFRFFEIDLQYFYTSLPFALKLYNVLVTDLVILRNILLRAAESSVILKDEKIYYDTIFATKTFLAAAYDFYIETKRLTVLPKEPIVVDIGANIGQYLFAVKSFFPRATVYSFEPDPTIFAMLKKNASQYRRTYIEGIALGSKKGNFRFYRSKQFSEWSSLIKPGNEEYETIKVPVGRGNNVKALQKLHSIDLIKIDVEGAELEVLHGMKKIIKKANYLLIETSLARDENRDKTNELFLLLFREGFVLDHIGRIFSDGSGRTQGAVDLLFINRRYYEKKIAR